MPSRTAANYGRRPSPQADPEDSYPHIPEPKQGHAGNLLAFLSVLAVLGFGAWAALGAFNGGNDKPAVKATAAATAPVATKAAAAVTPAATSGPTAAPAAAPATAPAATPAAKPSAPQPTPGPGGSRVHIVGDGDTLYRIASRYGTTVEAIMAANGFTDRSKILHVGDRLTIP